MEKDTTHSKFKYSRTLLIYTRLVNGEVIKKIEEAERFGVGLRAIQHDLDDLRAFFANENIEGLGERSLVYDRRINGYYLKSERETMLTEKEGLAICKILLESRALRKDEVKPIIDKLLNYCIPKRKQMIVQEMIANELYHYVELQHKKALIDVMWDIGMAVREHYYMEICYERPDGSVVKRKIMPVGIMFSEFYFYMPACIEGIDRENDFDNKEDFGPTIYRLDRIKEFKVLIEHFIVPYKDRFEEGEFRKRVQFMHGGGLKWIKFLFKGVSAEPVLDRLPTAKVMKKTEDGYVISAKVYGDGVDMWLRSQGERVEML